MPTYPNPEAGAAILLSNKKTLLSRAKYRLRNIIRTQITDDESYGAVFECEDASGFCGVRLSKEIVKVAGNAMRINLTQLGPLILPLSEQAKVVWSILLKRFYRGQGVTRCVAQGRENGCCLICLAFCIIANCVLYLSNYRPAYRHVVVCI